MTIDHFVVTLAALLICASIGGALVGILVSATIAKRLVAQMLPPFPEFIAVQKITLNSVVTLDDETVNTRHVISTTAPEITTFYVEKWLANRELMMTPKGKDFSVPLKARKDA